MTPFSDSLFELYLCVIFIFVFEKFQNLFLWGLPFGQFWSAKYLNLKVKAVRSGFCPI